MDTFKNLIDSETTGGAQEAVKAIPEIVRGAQESADETSKATSVEESDKEKITPKKEEKSTDAKVAADNDFFPGKYIRPPKDDDDGEVKSTETKKDLETAEDQQKKETNTEEKKSEFDFSVFGDKYNSTDDVKSELSRIGTMEDEIKNLKEALSKSQSPYADPEIARINALYSKLKEKGIDITVAQRLSSISEDRLDNMSDIDILVLEEIVNSNEINVNEQMLHKMIARNYKTQMPSEEDLEEMEASDKERLRDDVEMEIFRRKNDADKARARLRKIVAVDLPETKSAEELVQAQNQAKEKLRIDWKPVVPKILDEGLKEIPIPNGTWSDVYDKFVVDQNDRKLMQDKVMEYVVESGMPLNERSVKEVHSAIVNQYILDNLPAMFKVAINKATREALEKKDKDIENPSALKREVRESQEKRIDDQQENFNRLV